MNYKFKRNTIPKEFEYRLHLMAVIKYWLFQKTTQILLEI